MQTGAVAGGLREQQVWSAAQCAHEFFNSVQRLKTRSGDGLLEFSKDDDDALSFVTAASNLRAHVSFFCLFLSQSVCACFPSDVLVVCA